MLCAQPRMEWNQDVGSHASRCSTRWAQAGGRGRARREGRVGCEAAGRSLGRRCQRTDSLTDHKRHSSYPVCPAYASHGRDGLRSVGEPGGRVDVCGGPHDLCADDCLGSPLPASASLDTNLSLLRLFRSAVSRARRGPRRAPPSLRTAVRRGPAAMHAARQKRAYGLRLASTSWWAAWPRRCAQRARSVCLLAPLRGPAHVTHRDGLPTDVLVDVATSPPSLSPAGNHRHRNPGPLPALPARIRSAERVPLVTLDPLVQRSGVAVLASIRNPEDARP